MFPNPASDLRRASKAIATLHDVVPGIRICVLLALLLALSACDAVQGADADSSAISGTGTLQGRDVALASELGGRIVALYAGEGESVVAGEALVSFDTTTARTQVAQARAAVSAAEANYARLRAAPREEELRAAEAALEAAQAEADGAERALLHARYTITSPVTLNIEISQAQTAYELAEQAVEGARADMEAERFRYHIYVDLKDDVSPETRRMWDLRVQAAELAVVRAEAEHDAARAELNALYDLRAHPLQAQAELHAARAAYTATLAAVEEAQANLDQLRAGTRPEELTIAHAQLLQARAALTMALTQRDMLTLTAPISGVIAARSFTTGEIVAPGRPIFTLSDLEFVYLTLYVPEHRIGEVSLGQRAEVTVDAYPGERFTGTVDRIASEAEYTPRTVEVTGDRTHRVFAVRIRIRNVAGRLMPGLPARGTLLSP